MDYAGGKFKKTLIDRENRKEIIKNRKEINTILSYIPTIEFPYKDVLSISEEKFNDIKDKTSIVDQFVEKFQKEANKLHKAEAIKNDKSYNDYIKEKEANDVKIR